MNYLSYNVMVASLCSNVHDANHLVGCHTPPRELLLGSSEHKDAGWCVERRFIVMFEDKDTWHGAPCFHAGALLRSVCKWRG